MYEKTRSIWTDINDDGIINEQIYISSPELDTKLMEYMQNLEEQQLKEQQ